jgi:peptide/nickel transport system permease protein
MNEFYISLRQIKKSPAAISGLMIVGCLCTIAILAPFSISHVEAIRLWRGGENVWIDSPKNARPSWFQYFYSAQLPTTLVLDTRQIGKKITIQQDGTRIITAKLQFEFPYTQTPSELGLVILTSKYQNKSAESLIMLQWKKPNGQIIQLADRTPIPEVPDRYWISADEALRQQLQVSNIEDALFSAVPGQGVLTGTYELAIEGFVFEPNADLDAKLIVYGKLHGWAGTDHLRRDLGLALLWGTPMMLLFGFVGAIGTILFSPIIAAFAAWYGGRIDTVIQRMVEINAMLPKLVLLIIIGIFYSPNIWIILLAIIVLNIFNLGIKSDRVFFLQLKELPYIEAARAYGASDLRIIFRYLIPRLIPMLVPRFVIAVPSFVFLEASLGMLGINDPNSMSWGSLLNDAYEQGALYNGQYYWVLEPTACLMLTGIGFSLIGATLDRIFNPRLRHI